MSLVAVGQRMPGWVQQGFSEYAQRLRPRLPLQLVEIPAAKRGADVQGADGFAPEVLQRANERWSLSPLTLPHALVRVVFAEQIYRAVTLLDGHPYHRE